MRPFQLPTGAGDLLPVEEAQTRVLDEIAPGAVETVPLIEAHRRVLREDVTAADDVPCADNSAMDGYALRAADTLNAPATLRVIGEMAAGRQPVIDVKQGTAVRIMTGAPIPDSADAVAQVEITDGGTESVTIASSVKAGVNIRRRGEDMRAGATVLRSGMVIGAAEIGALATAGRASVTVGRRPSVAILATGDELVEAGQRGGVVNSNSYALAAMVRDAGGEPRLMEIVRDTKEATIRAIEAATESEFILSSGGVSVGAYDFIREALVDLGAELRFWRVAMKPGKPVLFARLRNRIFFGLPGNPASSMVSFHLFVGPALRKAAGQIDDLLPATIRAVASSSLKGVADRRTYVRVRIVVRDGTLRAEPIRVQGSHQVSSMVHSNGLAVLEAGTSGIDAGSEVPVILTGAIRSVI